ncbi:MAG: MFS transporter [Actinomycetales bacterium]
MTREPGLDGDAPAAGTSYRALLRRPGALRFVLPASMGRLPQAMFGVGVVLLVEGYRDSYAVAGAVGAVLALGTGLGAPVLGRLADRWGQSAVTVGAVSIHVPGLVALVVATVSGAPAVLLAALAAVIGATTPILGSFSRVRWRALTGGEGDRAWDRALALESVVDEATFVIGPSLAALLATQLAPSVPLLVAAVVTVVGVSGFLAARDTEPSPGRRTAGSVATRGRPVVLDPGMGVLVLVPLCLGVVFGATEVGIIAAADGAGVPIAAGVLVSVFAAASLVGGLVYGARRWRSAPPARLAAVTTALGVAALLVPWSAGLWTLGGSLVLLGLAVAPTLIAINAVVAVLVRPGALTEGFTWALVALLGGVATGTASAGALVDARGGPAALWLTAGAGAGVVLTGALAARVAGRVSRRRATATGHPEHRLLTSNMTVGEVAGPSRPPREERTP